MVGPIRRPSDVAAVKRHLKNEPRNLLLFTLGINTGYRANELLCLKVRDVKYLEAGDQLEIYQSKTKKYRRTVINESVYIAIQAWLKVAELSDDDPLFISYFSMAKKGTKQARAITVIAVNLLIKKWCADCDIQGNYGSHTMRKTWGYHQRKFNNVPLYLLMMAFGHTTPRQTLEYLSIQEDEVSELFNFEI